MLRCPWYTFEVAESMEFNGVSHGVSAIRSDLRFMYEG